MPNDLLAAAEAELADIERKLADMQPLAQRRDQLRMFLSIGRTLYATPVGQGQLIPPVVSAAVPAPPQSATPGQPTVKMRVIEAAAALIAANGPLRTRDILAHLQAQGIEVGGSNKLDTVSVILSRTKDRFKPDRALGWSLVDDQKEATPPVAPTTAGS